MPCATEALCICTAYQSIVARPGFDWLYRASPCFQQYFNYIAAASAPIHAFLEFFKPVLRTVFFPSRCLLSL